MNGTQFNFTVTRRNALVVKTDFPHLGQVDDNSNDGSVDEVAKLQKVFDLAICVRANVDR